MSLKVRRVNRSETYRFTRKFAFADWIKRRGACLVAKVAQADLDPFAAGSVERMRKGNVWLLLRLQMLKRLPFALVCVFGD